MAGSGARWFRYGCFGCLGVVAILILVCAVLFTMAWVSVRSEQVERQVYTPEIDGKGGVFFDVAQAELRLEPAGPGESLRVEAQHDANAFTLEEGYAPGGAEGEPWSYRVSLRRTSEGGWADVFKGLLGASKPILHVYMPPDVPVDLGVQVVQGGAAMQLGGLTLTSAEIDVQQGGADLRIDEPLQQPMEHLSITTAMGGANLEGLANASPKKLDLRYSMGGVSIDLRGRWRNDSDITIEGSMGGGTVWLPDNAIFEGLDRGGIEAPVEPELKPPTLRFTTSSAMGELNFID
jgi:hypothetical protein